MAKTIDKYATLDQFKGYKGKSEAQLANEPVSKAAMERAKKKEMERLKAIPKDDGFLKSLRGPSVDLPKYKKGGKVKKTGLALVHKGERVLTKKQAAKPVIKKAVKKVSKRK